jgi:serine phosphatase RsbU (regulator of sigma subunit)
VVIVALLSIPLSMSIYLAYDFSQTNRNLQKKLVEVEELSAKTIAQEKEKQEILSQQKEVLEIQVEERTREVVQQKKVIEEKNKDITDSINYAKRIQDAILPSEEQIKKMLPESFVLFKPKDIVSGDFYFFAETGGRVIAAAVDCTGHGVPGAFMSMVGANHLKRIVTEQKITDTSKILDELHRQVLHSLNRDI